MQGMESIFFVIILIVSVIIHELAHGYAALSQGDTTALYAGRLTANPIPHLDLIGSVILPLLLVVTNAGFILGWAKPVPYNPDNIKSKPWGEAFVAVAGVLANLAIALVFGLLLRFAPTLGIVSSPFISLAAQVVLINIVLAIFNLVPIPPLDGSRIIWSFLSYKGQQIYNQVERYSFILIIAFVFFGWQFINPIVMSLFTFFTGISL